MLGTDGVTKRLELVRGQSTLLKNETVIAAVVLLIGPLATYGQLGQDLIKGHKYLTLVYQIDLGRNRRLSRRRFSPKRWCKIRAPSSSSFSKKGTFITLTVVLALVRGRCSTIRTVRRHLKTLASPPSGPMLHCSRYHPNDAPNLLRQSSVQAVNSILSTITKHRSCCLTID
jgi:hypothetical protein